MNFNFDVCLRGGGGGEKEGREGGRMTKGRKGEGQGGANLTKHTNY